VIPPDSSPASIRDTAAAAIASDDLRTGAARMAEIVAAYGDGARAMGEVTTILAAARAQTTLQRTDRSNFPKP
jgi:hypothetical protein